jgi:hypothetical protein
MNDPAVVRFVSERVRPDAERVRAAFARGVDMAAAVRSSIAPLLVAAGLVEVDAEGLLTPTQGSAGVVIDDGRAREGVNQLTIGELCTLVNTFGGMTAAVDANQAFLDALSRAAVRPLEVSG